MYKLQLNKWLRGPRVGTPPKIFFLKMRTNFETSAWVQQTSWVGKTYTAEFFFFVSASCNKCSIRLTRLNTKFKQFAPGNVANLNNVFCRSILPKSITTTGPKWRLRRKNCWVPWEPGKSDSVDQTVWSTNYSYSNKCSGKDDFVELLRS